MQNQDYSTKFGISQTAIKDWLSKSPSKWKKIWIDGAQDIDKPDSTFIFGSLVDTLLFTPKLMENRFFIGSDELPSKAIANITTKCYEYIIKENRDLKARENQLHDYQEIPLNFRKAVDQIGSDFVFTYADAYKEKPEDKSGWQMNWKKETRLEKIIEQGSEYFEFLVKANGKKVISNKMNAEALELKEILLKNSDVYKYFNEEEGVELRFQQEFFLNFPLRDNVSTIPVKGALDILRIDHNEKTIQIIDFKTTVSAYHFKSSIRKYGYDLQLSFYDALLRLWCSQDPQSGICDYTIIAPINIAIDANEKIPYIYEYSFVDLAFAREGNEKYLFDLFQTNDHPFKVRVGWEDILNEIGWHYTAQYWDKPRELVENGRIKLNLMN